MKILKNKIINLSISFSIIYVFIYYLWLILGNGKGQIFLLGAGILGVLGPLLAIFIIALSFKTKRNKVERKCWIFIFSACVSYLIAEIIWRYHLSYLGVNYTFPGIADFFYIMFIFIYAIGLIYKVSATWKEQALKSIQLFFDAFIIMIVITTVCWINFFQPILESTNTETSFLFFSLGYPVALLGLFLGVILVYLFVKQLFSPIVLYLNIIGVLVYIFSDFIYLYQLIYSSYEHFSLLTPVWNICLLLIAISSLFSNDHSKEISSTGKNSTQKISIGRIAFPYISLIILLVQAFINKDELLSVFIGLTAVLFLLIFRQILTLKENESLIRDITARTKELEKVKSSLDKSEKWYRSLMEYHPFAIFSVNKEGEILSANKESERILGLSLDELKQGGSFTIKETLIFEDEAMLYFHKVLTGEPQSFETKVVNKEGNKVDLNLTYIPSIINDKVLGVFVMGEDLTNKKKTAELFLKSEKLSVVSRLAAAVAHEVRNPLTTIKGFLQIMNESLSVKKEFMGLVISELNRVETIIYEFLSLAKPHYENTFALRDIGVTLKEITDLLKAKAIINNSEISLHVPDDIPLVYCSENQLKQVFINIIQNALEATGSNGYVSIEAEKREEKVVIRIIDKGCGIPQERLQRLGEPFYSTKEKGTGVGLMVCYKIIGEHGGNIEFFSEENVGTTVEISLPFLHTKKTESQLECIS